MYYIENLPQFCNAICFTSLHSYFRFVINTMSQYVLNVHWAHCQIQITLNVFLFLKFTFGQPGNNNNIILIGILSLHNIKEIVGKYK